MACTSKLTKLAELSFLNPCGIASVCDREATWKLKNAQKACCLNRLSSGPRWSKKTGSGCIWASYPTATIGTASSTMSEKLESKIYLAYEGLFRHLNFCGSVGCWKFPPKPGPARR